MLTVLPAQVEHSDFASAHRPWYPCLAGRDAGTDRTPAAGWRKSGLTEQDSSPVPEGHACTRMHMRALLQIWRYPGAGAA